MARDARGCEMTNRQVILDSSLPHSLPPDWQPSPLNQPPTPPDCHRCEFDNKVRVLCGPCKRRLGYTVIVCDQCDDCHCAKTDAGCSECGEGKVKRARKVTPAVISDTPVEAAASDAQQLSLF